MDSSPRTWDFPTLAGPDGHQAVAIRVNSDMSAFYNCRLDGYQDTLCYPAGAPILPQLCPFWHGGFPLWLWISGDPKLHDRCPKAKP
ncbi:hypothetical protein NC653_004821 [Populus alba x Populus x berolinensis]|uniref:Pectinesterase catalytic domain-containing protein n=1 Tax=Populus alba x Populus x berolinensis TaxID=444605 RepID=A0AAD6WKE6_9ROSI|nr:hypothetical protein NC653_004821 [Populus alba x Populus x berolinensis]